MRASSPLSTIFMQETCSSPEARAQLDHSFKLHRGFGMMGSKVYYLVNVCLYPESILGDDDIGGLLAIVFASVAGRKADSVISWAELCQS